MPSDNDTRYVELAKAAYHAYGAVTDWKNYQGFPMPQWENLPQKIQWAWEASVRHVKLLVEMPLPLDKAIASTSVAQWQNWHKESPMYPSEAELFGEYYHQHIQNSE